MKTFQKVFFAFIIFLCGVTTSFASGYLPRDRGDAIIQGTAPDVFTSLSITTGSNTLTVTNDLTVRFVCNYAVTYYFGTGTPWPVGADQEEYVLVPVGKTTLTINSATNPTTCYIQEGRK